jgi:hypothetical protein
MPSLKATLSMDAAQFNAAAQRVTERTRAMAAQMGKAGFGKASVDAAMAAEKFSGMKAEMVKMGMSPAAAQAALKAQEMADKADKAAKSTSALGGAAKMMGAYLTVDFLRGQAQQILEYGGKISDLSARLGISTTAVQEWGYALKQNGGDVEDMSRFFERLAMARRDALEGNDKKAASFEKLGVSKEMLQTGSLEDIGARIGKSFEGGADPQQFMAELRDVGGRAAGNMVAMFSQGFGQLAMEARDLGVVMSESTIASLDTLGDRLDQLKMQFQTTIAPVFVTIGELAINAVKAVSAMLAGWKGFLGGVSEGAKEGGLMGLANPLLLASKGFKGFMEGYGKAVEGDIKEQDVLDKVQDKKKEGFKLRNIETKDEKKERLELERADKKAATEQKDESQDLLRLGKHQLSQRQQMGGFGIGGFASSGMIYGPEQAAQNAREKMVLSLESIEKLLKARGQSWDTSSTTVDY